MNKIWYAWAHIPNGVTMVKIENYNKIQQTCAITFSGGLTCIDFPMKDMEAINGCVLPWEDKND